MKAEKLEICDVRHVDYVLVTGGRDYTDAMVIADALVMFPEDAVLVHGNARGADQTAAYIWKGWGRKDDPHSAEWTQFGRAAGVIRNQAMLESGVDLVVAFPGGVGTADMVRRAKRAGVEVREIA